MKDLQPKIDKLTIVQEQYYTAAREGWLDLPEGVKIAQTYRQLGADLFQATKKYEGQIFWNPETGEYLKFLYTHRSHPLSLVFLAASIDYIFGDREYDYCFKNSGVFRRSVPDLTVLRTPPRSIKFKA